MYFYYVQNKDIDCYSQGSYSNTYYVNGDIISTHLCPVV